MKQRKPESPETQLFPIVGIGASAGGLEALMELLNALPDNTGMAFVLIQHLDPTHGSRLTELLSKGSRMRVAEVQGQTRVEPNCVYVIPSERNLTIADGVLQTPPRSVGRRNMPIDDFLQALAQDRGSRAFGVILSGTATDGTAGLEAIKSYGGMTFAQDLESAKFEGMPSSAIAAGVVDLVLPPAAIAKQLIAISKHKLPEVPKSLALVDHDEPELGRLLQILRATTGADFTHYKPGTIKRHLQRRMGLGGFENLPAYAAELQRNHEEAAALAQDFLITVTTFFREPSAFKELTNRVFPALILRRKPKDGIRIWVPGCATGEEAYSIAICLTEFLEQAGNETAFQVFATDANEAAIEKAREGVYPESALANVSAKRLGRFFTKSGRGYRIDRAIRKTCMFAKQNLGEDPPFSKLDLISCCNVLIYMGPVLQRKVLSAFHYALTTGGRLILGPSESIAGCLDLFQPTAKNSKVYARLPSANGMELVGSGLTNLRETLGEVFRPGAEVQKEADRLILAEYAPPGVVIDEAMNIVQIRGRTGPYLELSVGEPSHDVLKLAREGLVAGLSKAIRAARQKNVAVREEGLRISSDGEVRDVAIKVIPFNQSCGPMKPQVRHFLILFEDTAMTGKPPTRTHDPAHLLQRELAATKEYLQSIIESKETALEELMSFHEEAQVTNEELETAKEELQSTNEELSTLNEQQQTRNTELSQVNRDLASLLESIDIPLVMVGKDLRIRRFTQSMGPMLNAIPSDVGRPIGDLHARLEMAGLRSSLLQAIEHGKAEQRDVRDANGCWYSLRVLPLVTLDGSQDGAVAMLIDVDAATRGRDFAEATVNMLPVSLMILSEDLRIIRANRQFYETFQVAREETEGRIVWDVGNGQWDIPRLRELFQDVLREHAVIRDFEVRHEFEHVGKRTMMINAAEVFDPNEKARTILLAVEDITARKRAEEALKATNAELQQFAYALSHDLREPLRMVVNFTELLAKEQAGKLGEPAETYIASSVDGAMRIQALMNSLLAYWEVAEKGGGGDATVDCNEILAETLLNFHSGIAESGATVTFDPLPAVSAEKVMMGQLFQNLIGNAIKYRGEAPLKIHIRAERTGENWLFSVEDNGIGIEPQHRELVFGIFKRLHGEDIPGAGMGLTLCRRIVERYGGRIWVESAAARGSVFKFTLPARQTVSSKAAPA